MTDPGQPHGRPAAVGSEPGASARLDPGARRALGSFLDGLRGRNASPGTVTEYRRNATEFLAFLAERRADWRTPDRATVRAYLSRLAERGLAPTSVGGRLAAVRSLYRHALRHGRIEIDPLAGVRAPRRPSRLPRVLSVDEAAALVTAPGRLVSRDPALARRDGAMLELLYATGMRISELAGLTVDRVDLGRRRLRVTGKGNKERQLLFGEPAALAMRAYLDTARPMLAARGTGADGAVFLNAHGGPLTRAGRAHGHRPLGRTLSVRRAGPAHTRCATRSRPTCSRVARTCAWSRSCSATRISRRRRSTPTCPTPLCAARTAAHTRALDEAPAGGQRR